MGVGRFVRLTAGAVALGLVMQMLPVDVGRGRFGTSAASADPVTPTPPPAAVNPTDSIRTVLTPGPTQAPSQITTDTVWGPQGSPYLVQSLNVAKGASLTLLPGTVVKMNAGAVMVVYGQLLSLGAPQRRVTVTSIRDDTVLGDTNADGSATAPAPGNWKGIELAAAPWEDGFTPAQPALIPASVLDYTDIRYGGGTSGLCDYYGSVDVASDGAPLVMSNSSITRSSTSGLYVYGTRERSPVGIYNSRFGSSCIGLTLTFARADVVGNTFDSDFSQAAVYGLDPHGGRMRFNTVSGRVHVSDRTTTGLIDTRFNTVLGSVNQSTIWGLDRNWSGNWFGRNANDAFPACVDPAAAAAFYPPVQTQSAPECTPPQLKVVGYTSQVLPALSGSPQVLPAFAREAAAPRVGPVNAYAGTLTYQVEDFGVEDAGKRLTATRNYRSDRLTSGDAGTGWSSAYTESVSQSAGVAALQASDGTSVPFATDPAAGYTPAPGVSAGYASGSGGTTVTTPDRDSYEFNASGELTGMTVGDPGHRIDVDRTDGQVSRVTGVSGRYLAYQRSGGKLDHVTDGTRTVGLSYTGARLTAVSGVDARTERYEYDSAGRLTKVTTPLGRVKLAAGYDGQGRVAWLEQLGTGRSTFAYDTANGRTVTTLPGGANLTQEYDWAGRLVAERLGRSGRHVVYDGEGRLVAVVGGVPDVPMDGYGPSCTATFFDANGDQFLSIDPVGKNTRSTFDSAHRPLVTTLTDFSTIKRTYDGQGRLETVTDPAGKLWRYTYNNRGQLTSRKDPLDRTRTMTYAANGDLTGVTDEFGATTTYGYDTLGRRTSTRDALLHTREVAYTAWDTVSSTTSARDGESTVEYNGDRQQTVATDPTGRATTYEYDTAGRLATVVDAAGGHTTTGYDALGRPVSVTDARQSVLRQSYTGEGWLDTTTDANGKVTSYGPDPSGRVHRLTDPLGQVTQTGYDRAGHPTDVWTPDGGRTVLAYDLMGRQTTLTTPRGNVWRTEYDRLGRPTKSTDPLTYTVLLGYDAVGRITSRTDQNGVATAVAYDDAARKTTTSDPVGTLSTVIRDLAGQVKTETDGTGVRTSYDYDADGNLTTVSTPAGSTTGEYDLAGRMTATVDPMQRRTSGSYDELGRLDGRTHPDGTTDVFGYDPVGNLTGHTDRTGAHWGYTYDPANRLKTQTDPLTGQTAYTYDDLGRQTSVTDQAGVVTHQAYDPVGRPAVRWDAHGASWVTQYDADGNTSKSIDPVGVTWKYTVNARNEVTYKEWGTADPWHPAYSYTYDKVGRPLTANEPYATTYEYDVRGRLRADIDAYSNRTELGYDAADRVTSRTTPSGKATTWTYDTAGRLATAADPLHNTSSYNWNAAGQLTKITLPRGGTYRYGYDTAGRLDTETDPLQKVTAYDYDGEGRLTSTSYPTGRTVYVDYDAAGRVEQQTGTGLVRTFGYDAAGRLASATSTGTPALGFGYDDRGLLTRSTNQGGDTAYAYDNARRLTAVSPPAGPATTYGYDTDRGLLATVRGATNVNFTDYDSAGQLKTRETVAPSGFAPESRFYDYVGRLSAIDGPTQDLSVSYHPDGQIKTVQRGTSRKTTYGYDDAGRLTSGVTTDYFGDVIYGSAYTWDADGNRTGVTTNGQPQVTADFDLADRLTSTSDGTAFGYDDDGQLRNAGATTYGYNGLGEQASVATSSTSVSYLRDGLGRMSSRTAGGATTSFGYDATSGDLAAAQTGTGPLTSMIRTPDGQLLAQATAGATTQQAWTNVHGDVVALKDDTGSTLRWTADYDPFGKVTASTGTAAVPLGFQSRYTDPTSGLVDMGARPYDPGTGRFTTRDTIIGALTAPVSLHRYLYANADPINHTDPDGHWPQWLDDAAATVTQTIDAIVDGATDLVNSAVEQVSDKASEVWHDVTSAASRGWHATGNRAQQLATCAGRFRDEYGDQIKATAASIAVGVVAFAGCEALAVALSGGAATPLCMAAAGAAGGAVYGHMTCPDGRSQTNCVAAGALSGAVAALTFAVAGPLGPVAAGMLSGFTGDATDQLLTTGSYDPVRGAIAIVTGGALGWLGGRYARTPTSKLRMEERPALRAPTACKVGPNSFVAGTLVLMADGTRKPIEQIRVGDKVLASDPDAVRTEPEAVETTIVGQGTKNLVDITVDTDGATGSKSSTLVATDQHPFWVDSEHRWVDARDLRPGDLLRTAAGTFVQVTAIHTRTETTHAYNLTVSTVHTYYVLAGDTPVLVHNTGGCGPSLSIDKGQFGKKWGDHSRDYGFEASSAEGRAWYRQRIEDIHNGPHEVRVGRISKDGPDDFIMYRQGDDLLITKNDGSFVSLYPGGNTSGWFAGATPRPCACG